MNWTVVKLFYLSAMSKKANYVQPFSQSICMYGCFTGGRDYPTYSNNHTLQLNTKPITATWFMTKSLVSPAFKHSSEVVWTRIYSNNDAIYCSAKKDFLIWQGIFQQKGFISQFFCREQMLTVRRLQDVRYAIRPTVAPSGSTYAQGYFTW